MIENEKQDDLLCAIANIANQRLKFTVKFPALLCKSTRIEMRNNARVEILYFFSSSYKPFFPDLLHMFPLAYLLRLTIT